MQFSGYPDRQGIVLTPWNNGVPLGSMEISFRNREESSISAVDSHYDIIYTNIVLDRGRSLYANIDL